MKTYELHTFTKGEWIFDSVYEDCESAKAEAWRQKESGKHSALSVIEEIFDETTNSTSSRTIYTTGDSNARTGTGYGKAREGPSRHGNSNGAGRTKRYRGRDKSGMKISTFFMPMLALVTLLIAGAGALYALQLML